MFILPGSATLECTMLLVATVTADADCDWLESCNSTVILGESENPSQLFTDPILRNRMDGWILNTTQHSNTNTALLTTLRWEVCICECQGQHQYQRVGAQIFGGRPLVDWKQKSKRFALDFDYTLAAMETSVMKKNNECVLRQAAAMATN